MGEKRTILDVHLDGGSIGRLAHPQIEILRLPGFEEEHIVAVVQIRQLVELIQLRLRVQLGVLAAVRQQRIYVIQKVSVSASCELETVPEEDSRPLRACHPKRLACN